MSILRGMYLEGRDTLRGGSYYRSQTGVLPLLSIMAHVLHWFVVIAGLVLLVWLAGEGNWSRWAFAGVFAVSSILYLFIWARVKRTVKVHQWKEARRIARLRR